MRALLGKTGFTLIELLCVVAIVVTLAALCLPVASSLIRRASITKCSSNLKSIGAAAQAYAADHNGDWPYYLYNYDPPQPSSTTDSGGSQALITLCSDTWNGLGKLWNDRYLNSWQVLYCPADTGPDHKNSASVNWADPSPKGKWIGGSYSMRGYKQFTSVFFKERTSVKTMHLGSSAMGTCTFLRDGKNRVALGFHQGIYPTLFGDGSVALLSSSKLLLPPDNPPITWGNIALQRSIWFDFDTKK